MATTAAAGADDWRKSMTQSTRNSEVREIAKILASIDGQATPASKMMLSMKFEDQIFKSASSLDDYKKKIAKRLKKLQKAYAQQKAAEPAGADPAKAAAPATSGADDDKRQELLVKLRQTYGEKILYIIRNGDKALKDIERKLGAEKGEQFKPHIRSSKDWAQLLGIWEEEESTNQGSSTASSPKKKKPTTSLTELQRLEQHLEKRVENIRVYVAKHADPDLFLFETLERKDKELVANRHASKILAGTLARRIHYIQQQQQQSLPGSNGTSSSAAKPPQQSKEEEQAEALKELQESLEKAQASVPPPTRNDSKQLEGSLRHLDKIRAASTALMNYFTIRGDRIATAPPQTLKKIQSVMGESIDFVVNALKDSKKGTDDEGENAVTLQDAWTKRMELDKPILGVDDATADAPAPPPKRARTNNYKPYIKARLLFHPNRKTPSNLLVAMKRKGARLIRPGSTSSNVITTYLELEFGKAFTMTIYLSPLTVAIRAMPSTSDEASKENVAMNDLDSPDGSEGTATWKALSYGLTGSSTDKSKDPMLSVWGVSSTYDTIGHVVEERLRDASTHATYLLRKCFENHVKDKTVDFEVEILEGSALLEFLKVARETYIPQWQDYDL